MKLPIQPPFYPMEAKSVAKIPQGDRWEYEPKWDGFRCLVFRDGDEVELQSKSAQSLTRYFPEIVEAAAALPAKQFVVDGEIIVLRDGALSFDDLLQRIHPAASRVAKLSKETPAQLMLFDVLVDTKGKLLTEQMLAERRTALEAFAQKNLKSAKRIALSPATRDIGVAQHWLKSLRGQLDGIVAKPLDEPYRSGERVMQKIKNIRSADCVVGGFRYLEAAREVGSLLLGLYDEDGFLHHVGFTSSIKNADRKDVTKKLELLIGGSGFTGRAPGGPSRWSTKRSTEWVALRPELVVEVEYDHFSGGRFRHGTRFMRWRPDKAPEQCRMDQVVPKRSADERRFTQIISGRRSEG